MQGQDELRLDENAIGRVEVMLWDIALSLQRHPHLHYIWGKTSRSSAPPCSVPSRWWFFQLDDGHTCGPVVFHLRCLDLDCMQSVSPLRGLFRNTGVRDWHALEQNPLYWRGCVKYRAAGVGAHQWIQSGESSHL